MFSLGAPKTNKILFTHVHPTQFVRLLRIEINDGFREGWETDGENKWNIYMCKPNIHL